MLREMSRFRSNSGALSLARVERYAQLRIYFFLAEVVA